jgi:phosphoglycolate phosphatase-like HAD superfamily hydrolase
MLAVIDIDGVLADVRHRLHHVASRPKDWEAFFAAAPDDPVLEEGLQTARELAEVYDIVYLSGRPERCRQDTLDWFELHGLPSGALRLRRSGDRRPARVVKVEALDQLAMQAQVAVLVDDDPLVCEAAREAGYDVLPANWMPEQPALHEAQESDGRT